MSLSESEFRKVVAGTSEANIQKYYTPLVNAMVEFGIDTDERQVMFLAHIMVESGAMGRVIENLNYSAARLMVVFPKYYPNQAYADKHAGQPIKIASRVYANRMNNGDEASQDGWKYRGRGLKQLTGKYNYTNCGKALGYDLVNDPSYLETPEGAARSAAWFWYNGSLNKYADAHDIKGSTKAINGGYNGLEDREKYYNRGMAVIASATQDPSVPASNIPTSILKKGTKGEDVKHLQDLLNITQDGDFGPGTEEKVKAFQTAHGLTADGIVVNGTWKELING